MHGTAPPSRTGSLVGSDDADRLEPTGGRNHPVAGPSRPATPTPGLLPRRQHPSRCTASMRSSSRETVGIDATGPNSASLSHSTSIPVTASARSANAVGVHQHPVTAAASPVSAPVPAAGRPRRVTPLPSRLSLRFTSGMPSCQGILDHSAVRFSPYRQGHFLYLRLVATYLCERPRLAHIFVIFWQCQDKPSWAPHRC